MHPARPDLEGLYGKYAAHVHDRCRWLLGDEAEAWDATQETFLRASRGLDRFEGRASPRTWLDRIATRHCLNVLRARRVRVGRGVTGVEALDLERTDGAGDAAALARVALVRQLLGLVDEQTQEMAVYYFVDEMTREEVAAQVGLSVPTVRKRLEAFVTKARRLGGGR